MTCFAEPAQGMLFSIDVAWASDALRAARSLKEA